MNLPYLKVSKTFYKYFLSYFIIFFLLMTTTYGIFNFHYLNLYKEEIYLNNSDQTTKFCNAMDLQMDQISNLLKQITLADEFQPNFNNYELNRLSTVKRLYSFISINNFIYDIIYFQKNLDMAISSKKIMLLNTMENFHFRYANWSNKDMLSSIYTQKTPVWRPFEELNPVGSNHLDILTYIYPLSLINAYNTNLILLQIERSSFTKTLNLTASAKSIVIITDEGGNRIFSTIDDIGQYLPAVNSILPQQPSAVLSKEYGDLFVSCIKSPKNGWVYYNILPTKLVLEKVYNLRNNYVLFTALLFLFVSILLYIITYINYNPLKSLLQVIEGYFKVPDKNTSEIEAAKMALNYLSESSRVLNERIISSSEHVKISMILNLLRGKYSDIKEFNTHGKVYSIQFNKNNFFTVVFSYPFVEANNKNISNQQLISNIEQLLHKNYESYGIENLDSNHLIFLCSSDSIDEGKLRKTLKNIHATVQSCFGVNFKIGVSTFTVDITLLYRKYIEAVSAIEHSQSISDGDIAVFGSDKFNICTNYPVDELEKLKDALKNYDVEQLNSVSQLLLKYINGAKLSIFMKVCICYDIVNTIIKTMILLDKDALPELQKYNLVLTDKNSNLDKLSGMLESLVTDVSNYIINTTGYKENTLTDQIKLFIETHIFDYDFSIQKVADTFDMSVSNLSHYFKKNAGIPLSDYISDLKMSYAKDMLRNTDNSQQEIMKMMGYTSMSSFIRKFKSHTGTTPGEYKAIHGK